MELLAEGKSKISSNDLVKKQVEVNFFDINENDHFSNL